MVTKHEPVLVVRQLEARRRRKRSIHPDVLRSLAEQDRRLFDLLLRRRTGEDVGEAIAAELLPAVNSRAGRMSPVRLYGRDDLRQELMTEVFRSADRISLSRSDYLTRRLMLDAAKRVTRRLEREWSRQLEEWYRKLGAPTPELGDGPEDEQ